MNRNFHPIQRMSAEPSVVVIYGAPGTGKSTLLELVRAAEHSAFQFLTIDEPTHKPEIIALLKEMYAQTDADIKAGRSVTLKVQTEIMLARCATMKNAVLQIADSAREAERTGKKLILVCDGHPATDAALYGRAKHDAGEMSVKEFAWYCAQRDAELSVAELGLFRSPQIFVQLLLANDTDGLFHFHRVFNLRQSEAERTVQPGVYKRLADYADSAGEHLKQTYAQAHYTKIDTWNYEPVAVFEKFIALLNEFEKK